jgi:serine/threonine protein kinase
MSEHHDSPFAGDDRLNEIIAGHLEAVHTGQTPDRKELLARHPDLAPELEAFFADHDRVQQAAELPSPASPDYDILEQLGRGGMGVVYKAWQCHLNRTVALKMILHAEYAGVKERARFQTEAQAVARLQHPNIVQIFEIGEHNGHPFFAMEYCPGGSLSASLKGKPVPARDAAQLIEKLARAVQDLHAHQIVHRDLKPANVLLAINGEPKISDFGLAKKLDEAGHTQSGAILGTPSYMAPEQAAGKTRLVGPLTDQYPLGAILYELLTGRAPFKAATKMETLQQVIQDAPVPPSLLQPMTPRDLETICLKCLQKGPSNRYASCAALAEDLRRFLDGEPIRARPVPWWEHAVYWTKREPLPALYVGAFFGVTMTTADGGRSSSALGALSRYSGPCDAHGLHGGCDHTGIGRVIVVSVHHDAAV